MEEKEVCCEVKQEITVNGLLKENNEIILNIKDLTRRIRNNIFGLDNEEKEGHTEPQCMIEALGIQNHNLRCTIGDLHRILNTLEANK